jgi:general secretion pathway protein E/type IV pilus assembly protein PilB
MPGRGALDMLDEVGLCARASGLDYGRVRAMADYARQRGEALLEHLVTRGGVDEHALIGELARLLGLPFIGASDPAISPEILARISPCLVVSHQVIPLGQRDGVLQVGCWNPFDWRGWDELVDLVGCAMERVLCPRSLLGRLIKSHYGVGAETVARLVSAADGERAAEVEGGNSPFSEEEAANEPTVINLVNQILGQAIAASATDIHFEPHQGKYAIRHRIDGMLEEVPIPVSVERLKAAVVSRIKIMSGLDISEKRLPQDGRISVALAGQKCDLRVSIMPGIHGEAVVIRIQNQQAVALDLETLGFEPHERERIDHLITRPHGLVLVTGPTGSGKTTTLYAALGKVRSSRTKIITIEDPVEYWMDGMLQMQVHEKIGFTFSRALRSMLRHDPDIMLVGEIRDMETAEIAIRSALTGHLVFATLHTNDAVSAVTRLGDIGIEPFLVSSSVQGVLAQRLIRKICSHCRREASVESQGAMERGLLESSGLAGVKLFEGAGCEKCRFTGYRGRMAIGEVFTITSAVRTCIHQRQAPDQLVELARREGMRTLQDNALLAVRMGKTTLSEVLRVTHGAC